MGSQPTMKDVAALAGVALKTVSRYVNGETNINPALAERIGQAIESLGYRRNLAAASIRPGQTSKVLGLVISDLANPYFATLAHHVEIAARSHGYLLITASSEESGELNDRLIDRLIQQQVDGLLVVPPRNPARAWDQIRPPVPPAVALDRPLGSDRVDAVLADNYGGALTATRTLLGGAPGRIAFLGDSLSVFTIAERHRGFADAVAEHGGEAVVDTSAQTLEQAVAAAVRLLRQERIDALFAANNRSSMGAMLAFRQLGRTVPIIGFDDFEAAAMVEPPVSVVNQNIPEMGSVAVELLLRRLQGDPAESATVVVPTSLVLRGSELAAAQPDRAG